jgi:hypothetical protein
MGLEIIGGVAVGLVLTVWFLFWLVKRSKSRPK